MSEAAARAVAARTLPFGGGQTEARVIEVPVEMPVNLIYGGLPHVVLMATPDNLEDLALGFTLTEGIATMRGDIRGVRLRSAEAGTLIEVDLAPEAMKRLLMRRRSMAGRTGCGICGVESLDHLSLAPPTPSGKAVAPGAIAVALKALETLQPLHARTRGVHAAAWFDRSGGPLLVREDVGRHNALDKMIGACLVAGHAAAEGFVVITSRCSFEMVEKTAVYGAKTLVALSAPTSLALERAEALGVELIAAARADGALSFPLVPTLTSEATA